MKKILSLLLVLSLVLGSFSFAFADSDDATGHKNEEAIRRLMELELVEGDSQGIRPNDSITRAEFATFVIRALGRERVAEFATGSPFADVPESHWAAGAVKVSNTMGLVTGYGDGNFGPSDAITYEQALTLVVRAVGYEAKAEDRGGYPVGHLVVAEDLGLTSDVEGAAGIPAQRGDVFQMLDNALTVPIMEQVGFGDNKEYKVPEDVEDQDTLLSDLGYNKVTERVVAVNPSDNEITLEETEEVAVSEDFDFEANFGLEITAWIDGSEVAMYDVVDTPIFDAIALDTDEEVLTADDDYNMSEDVTLYANGSEEDLADLADNYDYAKVVLNADDEVIFVDAYEWTNSMIIDEIDDEIVIGYRESAAEDDVDVEDYVIVEDGKTISITDLEEGDMFYYNEDAEYAEVYNAYEIGSIGDIYVNAFEVDGDEYDLAGTFEDSNGNIDVLDIDTVEEFEESEEDVLLYVTRAGEARHMIGELEEVTSSTFAGILTNEAVVYQNRAKDYLALDIVDENGEVVSYDFGKDVVEESGFDFETVSIDANTVIELTVDEDGDVTEFSVENDDNKSTDVTTDVATDAKYVDGKRFQSNTVVFLLDSDGEVDEVFAWEDADEYFDTITDYDVYHSGGYADYLVVNDSDAEEEEEFDSTLGMLVNVRELANGDFRTTISIDGSDYKFDLEEDYTNDLGKIVEFGLNGEMDEIGYLEDDSEDLIETKDADNDGKFELVSLRSETFNVTQATYNNDDEYKLVDDAIVFDVTDTDDIGIIDIDDVEDDDTVSIFMDNELTTRFVRYLIKQ